jgi:myo-inositol 2-dehydrogenase/D-chiro-inositol 1-dehydrogenase
MTQPAQAKEDTVSQPTRRGFLGTSAAASMAAGLAVHSSVEAAEETRELRLAVVGCGGRGSGAINDSLSINDNIKLVAAADLYATKADQMRKAMQGAHEGKVELPDAKIYEGLDAYRRILDDPEVDVVIMTTSPGFRPRYVLDAVAAGKHVFAEKPSCVDPAGYRICLEAHAMAAANGTGIVTGTQYRRQTNYIGAVDQIRKGAIGEIVSATTRYCSTGIWYRPRQPEMSDAEYQMNNWMHFIWLSGDQIAEQAVHNIDTINWVMGSNPVSAYGSGGRFTRPAVIHVPPDSRHDRRQRQCDLRLQGSLRDRGDQQRVADLRHEGRTDVGDGRQHRRRLQAGAQRPDRLDPSW